MSLDISEKFETFSELLFHRYAVLAAIHACLVQDVRKRGRLYFKVYHSIYKGFIDGHRKVASLTDDEKLKMKLPQCCVYCGAKENLSIDHLIPTKRGGEDIPENYVWACSSCNSSKGAKDVISWLQSKNRYPSIVVYRRYIKLVLLYAQRHQLMHCKLSELPLDLPFDVDSIVDDSVLSIEHAQIFVGG